MGLLMQSRKEPAMPKQKTHKGLKKRVKVTATGKVLRKKTFGGHLMSGKGGTRRQKIRKTAVMNKADTKRTLEKLG
jgi:large subunit ribosomal protein L35